MNPYDQKEQLAAVSGASIDELNELSEEMLFIMQKVEGC